MMKLHHTLSRIGRTLRDYQQIDKFPGQAFWDEDKICDCSSRRWEGSPGVAETRLGPAHFVGGRVSARDGSLIQPLGVRGRGVEIDNGVFIGRGMGPAVRHDVWFMGFISIDVRYSQWNLRADLRARVSVNVYRCVMGEVYTFCMYAMCV